MWSLLSSLLKYITLAEDILCCGDAIQSTVTILKVGQARVAYSSVILVKFFKIILLPESST